MTRGPGSAPFRNYRSRFPNHGAAKGRCEYTVRAPAGGRGALSASGCPSRAAKQERGDGVSVKKVSRHTVRYKIREDVIGNPTAYQWRFDLPARACRRCVYDRIPNNHDKWHILHHGPPPISPIQHVVIIYQENHSFDNVLRTLCVWTGRCDGATRARSRTDDDPAHEGRRTSCRTSATSTQAQMKAINGGRMNGFANIRGCSEQRSTTSAITQYDPGQIPNLARLASSFAISDQTFQLGSVPSFGAHLELVVGDASTGSPATCRCEARPATGATAGDATRTWMRPGGRAPTGRSATSRCVPRLPARPVRVPVRRRLPPDPGAVRADDHGPAERGRPELEALRGRGPGQRLPLGDLPDVRASASTRSASSIVDREQVLDDARSGNLPNFSVVMPDGSRTPSTTSTRCCGRQLDRPGRRARSRTAPTGARPPSSSPTTTAAASTTTCPPLAARGIRMPMVIVSPYASRGTPTRTAPRSRRCSRSPSTPSASSR